MKKFLLFLLPLLSLAQEKTAPDYIKTIIFRTGDDPYSQLPIVSLGGSFSLSFDDLRGGETDYYYTLTHCNYNWQPSDLLKSEYLRGMDDVRLTQYRHSYSTLQPYTHYNRTSCLRVTICWPSPIVSSSLSLPAALSSIALLLPYSSL